MRERAGAAGAEGPGEGGGRVLLARLPPPSAVAAPSAASDPSQPGSPCSPPNPRLQRTRRARRTSRSAARGGSGGRHERGVTHACRCTSTRTLSGNLPSGGRLGQVCRVQGRGGNRVSETPDGEGPLVLPRTLRVGTERQLPPTNTRPARPPTAPRPPFSSVQFIAQVQQQVQGPQRKKAAADTKQKVDKASKIAEVCPAPARISGHPRIRTQPSAPPPFSSSFPSWR